MSASKNSLDHELAAYNNLIKIKKRNFLLRVWHLIGSHGRRIDILVHFDSIHSASKTSLLNSLLVYRLIFSGTNWKKKFAVMAFLTSSSLFAFFYKWLFSDFRATIEKFQTFAIIYVVGSAALTGIYLYLKEPLKNQRVFNLISWGLKLTAVLLLWLGVSFPELPASLVVGVPIAKILYAIFARLTFIPKLK